MNDLSNIKISKEDFKRERKYNAIKLPENLNQNMLLNMLIITKNVIM